MSKLKDYLDSLKKINDVPDLTKRINEVKDAKKLARFNKIFLSSLLTPTKNRSMAGSERKTMLEMLIKNPKESLPENVLEQLEKNKRYLYTESYKAGQVEPSPRRGSFNAYDLDEKVVKLDKEVSERAIAEKAAYENAVKKMEAEGAEHLAEQARFTKRLLKGAAKALGPVLTLEDFLFNTPPMHTTDEELAEKQRLLEEQE